ncbi:MAG: 2OG-Fe(II) oxygenase [Alphaproteobacteria bacterium]|nr:2OG-Fe(II) oxygenase [Alphaproteobacteria bacterium]
MPAPEIDYAKNCEALERLLASVDRPGDFCAGGRSFAPMPVLAVDGVGTLSFPVPDAQVEALIAAAERAPYGKGAETLVDATVRDCRQIDASRFRLGGRAWTETFATIMDAATKGLGCPAGSLEAVPYKLLVYEPGGFFAAHRDTEKADGMIATLTVSLPVAGAGSGGDLLVRHGAREMRVDMAVSEPSELAWAAFYADCLHEIEPVRDGFRLSLVFNLCLRPDAGDIPRQAPDHSGPIEGIARELAEWRDAAKRPAKLVRVLEHDYSEAGLSFAALKNADAAIGGVLREAAARAGFELFAAILHVEETGSPDEAFYERYDDWDRYDEDCVDVEMDEVLDGCHWLEGWADPQGGQPAFDPLPLRDGELLPEGALDDAAPDSQWVNEATGNEGVTVERAYRRAAFAMWPRRETPTVLAEGSIDAAVEWVARQGADGDAELSDHAGLLIDVWAGAEGLERDGSARARFCRFLAGTGDAPLALRFLREVVLPRYDGAENDDLPAVLGLLAPDAAGEWLVALVEAAFARRPDEIAALLLRTGETPGLGWGQALKVGVRAALAALPRALFAPPAPPLDEWRRERRREPIGAAGISDLLIAAWHCGLEREMETAATDLAAHSIPDLAEIKLPTVLEALRRQDGLADSAAYTSLWRQATDALLGRSSRPPEPPRDWTIAAPIPCECEICTELKTFCRNPAAQVLRFPLRKELRRHLHRQIDAYGLDMFHETQRRGRPFTLVCTKNRASYRRRLDEYAGDVARMEALIRLAPAGTNDIDRKESLRRAAATAVESRP